MLNQILKSVVFTGLIASMVPSIAQARPYQNIQTQPYQVFQTPNPGIHRNIIISDPQRIYPSPQRQEGIDNSYYPGYYNPYYRRPVQPSQQIIIINRDRPSNTPYYFRENIYYLNQTPYYFRGTPYYSDHTPYYSRQVPYYENDHPNNRGNSAPYGDPNFPSYPYYNSPNQAR